MQRVRQHAVEYFRRFGMRSHIWLAEPVSESPVQVCTPRRARQPQMFVEIVPSGSCGTRVVFRFE